VGSFLVVVRQEAVKDIHSCGFIVNIQVKIMNHRRKKIRVGKRGEGEEDEKEDEEEEKEEKEKEEEEEDDDDEKQQEE